jgi:hypothetical protein
VIALGLLVAALAAPAADRFVPPTDVEGDRTIVQLVFTDGSRADLVYPSRLRLAERGVVPYGSGTLRGGDGRDFVIRHRSVADVTAGWRRLGQFPRHVGFWDSGQSRDDLNFLAFGFGPWSLLVYDYPPDRDGGDPPMPDADRVAWARNLRGRVTRAGFLRLRGTGRLQLAMAGEHAGPQLTFGGAAGPLALTPGRCRRTSHHDRRIAGRWVNWDGRWANWCVSSSMRANAHGRRHFLRALIRSLEVL